MVGGAAGGRGGGWGQCGAGARVRGGATIRRVAGLALNVAVGVGGQRGAENACCGGAALETVGERGGERAACGRACVHRREYRVRAIGGAEHRLYVQRAARSRRRARGRASIGGAIPPAPAVPTCTVLVYIPTSGMHLNRRFG